MRNDDIEGSTAHISLLVGSCRQGDSIFQFILCRKYEKVEQNKILYFHNYLVMTILHSQPSEIKKTTLYVTKCKCRHL